MTATRVQVRDIVAVVSVVLVMFSGTFKVVPQVAQLPIDLTALALGLLTVCIIARVLADRGATPLPYGALVLAGAVVPGFFVGQSNPYTSTAQLGVLVSCLSALGAFWLLNSPVRRKLWLWSLVAIGVAVALLLAPGGSEAASVAGSGLTISAARALGVAIVVILTLVMHGAMETRLRILGALALATFLMLGLMATGSRGPFAGVGVALVLSAFIVRRPGRVKRIALVAAVMAAGWFALERQTNFGAERIRMALTGQMDNTASREGVWQNALLAIPLHPEGVGWGNFWSVLTPGAALDSGYTQSTHNLILSAFVEGGWLAGIALVAFITMALLRLKKAADRGDRHDSAVFCVAVFFVVCAMVSGSVMDDRATFAALAVAFAVRRASEGARGDTERPDRGVEANTRMPTRHRTAQPTWRN